MYSAITDSFNASNVSTVASLPKFPSEEPSKKDLDDWLDVAGAVLTRAGYGSAMRDETPPHLIHLSHSKDMAPITPLTDAEVATAGALESAKHKQLCAKLAGPRHRRCSAGVLRRAPGIPQQASCSD